MKLQLPENDSFIIYIDIVPYSETLSDITEDKIGSDDVIQLGTYYDNQIDTRWDILLNYMVPISKKIDSFPFVSECSARAASPHIEKGLSNYIDIIFVHPDSVSEQEIEDHYTYTIRFSDHENAHPEYGDVKEVDMTGMKAKNLEKAAIRTVKENLSDIKNDIKRFELKKYGKQVTFFD